jgi:ATPase subunit of ABC transporter with duplicated ATPase domains
VIDLDKQVREPLDPTALHVKWIEVERYRPIREFADDFGHHTVIRGMNGVGKTSLLNLISGVAGSDLATDLIADHDIGRLKIVLGAGNREYVYEAKDRLDRKSLDAFKAELPDDKRVNMAMSGFYYERFQYGRCDFATFDKSLRFFMDRTGHTPMVWDRPGRGAAIDPGDGVKRAIQLLYLASMRGGPLLLDLPEGSLDHRNKILMSMMIMSGDKQTITVTHSDEWGREATKKIEMK